MVDVVKPGSPWHDWFRSQFCVPEFSVQPTSEEEVVAAIAEAARRKLPVRVRGAGHSAGGICLTPGIQIDFDLYRDVISINRDKLQITIQPGMRVSELSAVLRKNGMSLNNQGGIDSQTAIGAMCTGTHGAGVSLPILANAIVGVRMVTAQGDLIELSEPKDSDLLKAVRVSLGLLGVVTAITVQAVPSYNIYFQSSYADTETILDGHDDLISSNRTGYFFWLPTIEAAVSWQLDVPGMAPPSRTTDICHVRRYNAFPVGEPSPALEPSDAFDHSSVIYPSVYPVNAFREVEYIVPLTRFREAFEELRHFQLHDHVAPLWPIECRSIAADEAWLSPCHGRPGVAISVVREHESDFWPALRAADAILDKYDGRPHWGKMHFLTRARLERLYPQYDAFKRLRREYDPNDMFLNDQLRPLFA